MKKFVLPFFLCLVCALPAAAAPLAVLQYGPQGETAQLTQIIARFSEAMRPLGVSEQDVASSPLKLTASGAALPAGHFRWLDAFTLAYLFDEPVDAPLTIDAVLPEGCAALSGARLEKPLRWSLGTPPIVLEVAPAGGGYLPPENGRIVLRSNYALDASTLRAELTRNGDNTPVTLSGAVEPERKNSDAVWECQWEVRDKLALDQEFTLRLMPSLRAQKGGSALDGVSAPLRGFSRLQATLKSDMGHENRFSDTGPVTFDFNNPVIAGDLASFVSVTPDGPPGDEDEAMWFPPLNDKRTARFFKLTRRWAPRTTYTVTLRAGLPDAYGTTLAEELRYSFTTGDLSGHLHMRTGEVLLPPSGLFRLDTRNIGAVDVRLLYVPWDSAAYAVDCATEEGWAALAALPGARQKILALDDSGRPGELVRHALPLAELLGFAKPDDLRGFVLIRAAYAGVVYNLKEGITERRGPRVEIARVQPSVFGLTLKRGRENSLAWVTDMRSGRPASGVEVRLVDAKGAASPTVISDEHGLALLPGREVLPERELLLVARKGEDVNILPVTGTDSHELTALKSERMGSVRIGQAMEPWDASLLTQLPLYRPGQIVRFAVFLRSFRERKTEGAAGAFPFGWLPITGENVAVVVKDARGNVLYDATVVSNAYGSAAGEFTLPETAVPGDYFFEIRCEGFAETRHGSVAVAEFRPPDFQVRVSAPPSQPCPPMDTGALTADVTAGYFSGAPVSGKGASTRLALRSLDDVFSPAPLNGFAVGLGHSNFPGDTANVDCERELALVPDEDGLARFSLAGLTAAPGFPQHLRLEATVTDPSGLTSQGREEFFLHPSAFYVGLRAPGRAQAGEPCVLEIKTAAFNNQPADGGDVRLRAERLPPGLSWEDRQKARPETVWEKTVTSVPREGTSLPLLFDREGVYGILASATDGQGRENRTRIEVDVFSREEKPEKKPENHPRGYAPLLRSEATRHKPGDTARILIGNPFPRATALVTLERAGVREPRVLDIDGPQAALDIPVSESDAPCVLVNVTLMRVGERFGEMPDQAEWEKPLENNVMQAILPLWVDDGLAPLDTLLETDRQSYGPGDTAQVRVLAREQGGAPVKTQVTLLAVDERVLRAAGSMGRGGYDPAENFAGCLVHSVHTSDIHNLLQDCPLFPGFSAFAFDFATASGSANLFSVVDDGFEAAQHVRFNQSRRNFTPMAFWLAQGETNDRGTLEASFVLPDTLTSWRIVAVAADVLGRFATAATNVTTSKPLQLLSALPRFAVEGDRLEARILVQNTSERDADVRVCAEADGAEPVRSEAAVFLKSGESGRAVFPLVISRAGRLDLTVRGKTDSAEDAAFFTLPLLPALPLETVVASGTLKEGEKASLPLRFPRGTDSRRSLEFVLAASPVAGALSAAGLVLEYPWNCLEQRVSRAWVRAMRLARGDLLGLPSKADD
ncbi:MAG: Ig-like domain-containing protein, partial [Desulfovibrio sp.]|nr:Ig-like domain-containing protein [Desulfovibrio sp.]